MRYTDVSTGAAQISGIEAQDWNLVQANLNQFSYFVAPPWTALMTAVAMNTQIFPTNNTYFRQAIVHAINYSDINSTVFFGQSAPMVGPEYPAWSQFYDLGNLQPYSYNLTLAQQDLNKSGITNPGTLEFSTIASCAFCLAIAQIVQGDLSQPRDKRPDHRDCCGYAGGPLRSLQHRARQCEPDRAPRHARHG